MLPVEIQGEMSYRSSHHQIYVPGMQEKDLEAHI